MSNNAKYKLTPEERKTLDKTWTFIELLVKHDRDKEGLIKLVNKNYTPETFYKHERVINKLFWNLKHLLKPHTKYNITKRKIFRNVDKDRVKNIRDNINSVVQYNDDENRWYFLFMPSLLDLAVMHLMKDKKVYESFIKNPKKIKSYREKFKTQFINNVLPNANIMFYNENPKDVWLKKIKKLYFTENPKWDQLVPFKSKFSFTVGPVRAKNTFYGANDENYLKLKFTEESLYSVSEIVGAEELYRIIKLYIKEDTSKMTITDGTTNIGSDSIYLSHKFKKVNSIEIFKDTFEVFLNNMKVLGVKNINSINGDTTKVLKNLKQDIVFMDAPWGGSDYRGTNKTKLYMSGKEISEIYLDNKDVAKLFIFKVPCNYDVGYFRENIQKDVQVEVDEYDFAKRGKCFYKFLVMFR